MCKKLFKNNNKIDSNVKEWISKTAKPYKNNVTIITFLSVLSILLSVGFAYCTKFLISEKTQTNKSWLFTFAGVIVGIIVLRVVVRVVSAFYKEKSFSKFSLSLRSSIYKSVLNSKYGYIVSYHTGDIMQRLTIDCQEVASVSLNLKPVFCSMIVQTVGAIVALFTIDWKFSIFLVVGGICMIAFTIVFRGKLISLQKEMTKADGKSKSFIQESLLSVMVIKAYKAEQKYFEKSQYITNEYYNSRINKARFNVIFSIIYSLLSNFGLLFAVIWCAVLYSRGGIEVGSILSIVLLMEQLQTPFTSFSSILPAKFAREASAERICEVISKGKDNFANQNINDINLSNIRFSNVDFGYENEKILTNFNAEILSGKFNCIVGQTGSGKSTLFKLLLALYPVENGDITIDVGGKHEKLEKYARQIFAFVPQGNLILSGTIKENILAFRKDEASEEDIKNALQISCSEYVYDLPNGLETILTEKGGGLSEGQLQRLAIARAILSKRKYLLLDEATSALDEKTETKVLSNIKNLGLTVIIISHKKSAVEIADNIIKVE